MIFFFLLTSLAIASLPPEAKDPIYDEYEGVKLADALHRDGKFSAALQVLNDLPASEADSSEARRVLGDIRLSEGNPREAVSAYRKALREASPDPASFIQVQLAKAYLRLGEKKNCSAAAEAAGETIYEKEETVLLKARCQWQEEEKAFDTLNRGIARLGTQALHLEKVRYLLHKKLFHAAYETALDRVKSGTPAEILSLAELFAGERVEDSLKLLEIGRLRHPLDPELSLALAPLFHRKGWMRATLDAFERASRKDFKYAEHAAELNRQLGAIHRARMFQPLIPGEKERVRHRLALSVETNRWELVSSLDPAVKRAGLLDDDEVNYALAFSLARLGDRDRASAYLSRIRNVSLLNKAAALRKLIEDCEREPCRF